MTLSIRKYSKYNCATFKSTKGKYGGLSNMAPGFPIKVNETIIKTSEALYQALRFPDYPEIQKQILSYPSPISAKKYGRTKITKTRQDWEYHRFKIMKFCLEVKFYQNNKKFSEILLQTNGLPIVEYTEKDKIWGAIDEGEFYIGTNALGRFLMELREKLQKNTFNLSIPDINNFKLLGVKIELKHLQYASDMIQQGQLFQS